MRHEESCVCTESIQESSLKPSLINSNIVVSNSNPRPGSFLLNPTLLLVVRAKLVKITTFQNKKTSMEIEEMEH